MPKFWTNAKSSRTLFQLTGRVKQESTCDLSRTSLQNVSAANLQRATNGRLDALLLGGGTIHSCFLSWAWKGWFKSSTIIPSWQLLDSPIDLYHYCQYSWLLVSGVIFGDHCLIPRCNTCISTPWMLSTLSCRKPLTGPRTVRYCQLVTKVDATPWVSIVNCLNRCVFSRLEAVKIGNQWKPVIYQDSRCKISMTSRNL